MTLLSPRRSHRRLGAGLGACLVLAVATAALVAGCGSSSKTAATSTSGRTAQVLATVRLGNLVDSVTGRVQLTSTASKAKGTVLVAGQNASQVAAGQAVTLSFFKLPAGVSPGAFGSGSARPVPLPPPAVAARAPTAQALVRAAARDSSARAARAARACCAAPRPRREP